MDRPLQVQILATEHWSLLATRTLTWNEMFARAAMFVTVLSASLVAIALVAQATSLAGEVKLFALLILPIVDVLGLLTFIRLGEANTDDIRLVAGMNRLRRGYLDIAPELEPYFTTSSHDDMASIVASYGPGLRRGPIRFLAGTPAFVGMVDVALTGAIAALATANFTDGSPAPRCSAELRWRLCRWRWFDGRLRPGVPRRGRGSRRHREGRAWNEAAGAICEVGTTAASVDHRKRDCG